MSRVVGVGGGFLKGLRLQKDPPIPPSSHSGAKKLGNYLMLCCFSHTTTATKVVLQFYQTKHANIRSACQSDQPQTLAGPPRAWFGPRLCEKKPKSGLKSTYSYNTPNIICAARRGAARSSQALVVHPPSLSDTTTPTSSLPSPARHLRPHPTNTDPPYPPH